MALAFHTRVIPGPASIYVIMVANPASVAALPFFSLYLVTNFAVGSAIKGWRVVAPTLPARKTSVTRRSTEVPVITYLIMTLTLP